MVATATAARMARETAGARGGGGTEPAGVRAETV